MILKTSFLIIAGQNSKMFPNRARSKSVCEQLGIILFLIFISFPLLLAGWLLITVPDRYQAEVDFRSKALSTNGIVAEIKHSTNCYSIVGLAVNCISHCDAVIQFTSRKGNVIQFWDDCTWFSVQEHQTVPVLYDPTALDQHLIKARIDRGDSPESRANADLITNLLMALISIGHLTYIFCS